MNFSSQNVLINFLILFISVSCKTSYQSRVFAENSLPLKPNYAEPNSWAVYPGRYTLALKGFKKNDSAKKADVFYIYPTLFSDKKNKDWNADIWTSSIRQDVFQKAIKRYFFLV